MSALREILERHVGSGYAAGALALLAHDDHVEIECVGKLSLGDGGPVQPDTIFRIASLTKPITAAAVLMLMEDGAFRLDTPVTSFLPELADRRVLRSLESELDDTVAAKRDITVEDLLTNRMGLGVLMAEPLSLPIQREIAALGLKAGFGVPQPDDPMDTDTWTRRLGQLPLMAQPGERWLYSTASAAQGVLIERAARMPFAQFLAERILSPLGMRDTDFWVPPGKRGRLATQYRPNGKALELIDSREASAWSHPPAFAGGDGGLAGTAEDYLRFSRWMLNRERTGGRALLPERAIAQMTRNHLTPAQMSDGAMILGQQQGWGYGLATAVAPTPRGLPAGTYGWTGGYGTSWIADPARALTAIVMTQTAFTNPRPPQIHLDVWRYAFANA